MRRLFNHFIGHEGGNFAIIMGLVLVPVMATIGAAVDYSQLYSRKSKMQTAADTAVLAAARDARTVNEFAHLADAYLSANLPDMEFEIDPKTGPRSVEVTVVNNFQTSFLGIAGMSEIPITVVTEVAIEKFGRGSTNGGGQNAQTDAQEKREYERHLKDVRRKLLRMADQLQPRERDKLRRKIEATYKTLMANGPSATADLPLHIKR